jgi:histone H1/5
MTESTTAPVSSVQSVQSSSPKKQKKTATKGKSTQGSSHPKYSDMIKSALKALNDRSGSSRAAILKFVLANYSLDPVSANQHLKLALKNGVKGKYFKQTKGNGASGSFKLVEGVKVAKKKTTKTKKSPSTASASGTKKRSRSKSAGTKPAKKVATAANTNSSATAPATTSTSSTVAAAKVKKVTIAKTTKARSSSTPKSATGTKKNKTS